jgi:hypothetical protein
MYAQILEFDSLCRLLSRRRSIESGFGDISYLDYLMRIEEEVNKYNGDNGKTKSIDERKKQRENS